MPKIDYIYLAGNLQNRHIADTNSAKPFDECLIADFCVFLNQIIHTHMRNHLLVIFLLMAGWVAPNGFVISKLGLEQGLSNNNIVSIVQDRKGFCG